MAMPNAEHYQDAVREWIAPVRAMAQPVSEGLFAGKLDFNKPPWTLDTLLFRVTVALGILPKGGRRDWIAVDAWAQGLLPILLH